MDKLFLYMPVWGGSQEHSPFPSDTLRLVSPIGPPGNQVQFNEGDLHGSWYLMDDKSLVIECAWRVDHTGPRKKVRFYPIAGTLAWASQHPPLGSGGWDALLLPFVEGSYPHESYPVNLMSVSVSPSNPPRARAAATRVAPTAAVDLASVNVSASNSSRARAASLRGDTGPAGPVGTGSTEEPPSASVLGTDGPRRN